MGARSLGSFLGVLIRYDPQMDIRGVPLGGIPTSLNQVTRKQLATIPLEQKSTQALGPGTFHNTLR